jgi:hypothetical protein
MIYFCVKFQKDLLYGLNLTFFNEVWRLIVFAPFPIIIINICQNLWLHLYRKLPKGFPQDFAYILNRIGRIFWPKKITNSKPKWSPYDAACLIPCKYPFPLKSVHFLIFNDFFNFYIGGHFENFNNKEHNFEWWSIFVCRLLLEFSKWPPTKC